jgi:hypothetical protein
LRHLGSAVAHHVDENGSPSALHDKGQLRPLIDAEQAVFAGSSWDGLEFLDLAPRNSGRICSEDEDEDAEHGHDDSQPAHLDELVHEPVHQQGALRDLETRGNRDGRCCAVAGFNFGSPMWLAPP